MTTAPQSQPDLLVQLDQLLKAPLYYTPIGERRSFDAAYQVIRAALAEAMTAAHPTPSNPTDSRPDSESPRTAVQAAEDALAHVAHYAKPLREWPYGGTVANAAADMLESLAAANAALAARCERMAEIEHLVWHCLDDSEERDGEQVIAHNDDFRKLVSLLSEDHPTTTARGGLASQAEGEKGE